MAVIQNIIEDELGGEDGSASGGDAQPASSSSSGSTASAPSGGGGTAATPLESVLVIENPDAEFMVQVAQLLVLLLILRELRRGS